MANTFAPFGLSQTGGAPGAAPNAEQAEYPISYSDTTKIYSGDPVQITVDGYIEQWDAGTTVDRLFGVFVGCKYLSVSQSKVVWSAYWPGADAVSGSVYGYVVPCTPGTTPRFVVQTGTSNSGSFPLVAVTQAYVGTNADVALGTGSTYTGRSGAYLDIATFNTTNTLPFRIIGLYQGVGNGSDATTAYNWVIVEANTMKTVGLTT